MSVYQTLLDMRNKRSTFIFIVIFSGFLIFILHLKRQISECSDEKLALIEINDDLNRRLEKVISLKTIQQFSNSKKSLPTVYAITPTYKRYEQKAELTRISQMLALVPHVHWIVVEDANENSKLVTKLLQDSDLINYTHLSVKTPNEQKARRLRWTKHRGVEQRNLGLEWLRKNRKLNIDKGIVYFMDDDNTYNVKIFTEMTKIKKVGIWPVGLVGGLSAEVPVLDPKTGRVVSYLTGWKPERPFAVDMAGFAINLTLILSKPKAEFSYDMEKGKLESEFLALLTTKEELEPLAENCTKILVWHTRTEKTKVLKDIPNIEV